MDKEAKIREIIAEISCCEDHILDSDKLEDLSMDSLDITKLEQELAEEFDEAIQISLPPSSTVREIIDHVLPQI